MTFDENAVKRLKRILERIQTGGDDVLEKIKTSKKEVLERYGPIFSLEHIPHLTAEEFKSFLLFENNKHWKSIHRQGGMMTEDMGLLREALKILLDENRPIVERLRILRPRNKAPMVKGLARSVITPILHVAYPEKYGVLNQIVENGMRELGLWPRLKKGSHFAETYVAVNEILHGLAEELDIDLWTLDALWWGIERSEDEETKGPIHPDEGWEFVLEKYLHEFLRDNWERTELGKEWELYTVEDEEVGFEYDTREVGKIDLLAKHKKEPRWLIIELKRGKADDQAVGQLLRYRGWVMRNLAGPNEKVEGIIISREVSKKLMYALENVKEVRVMTYAVSFRLHTEKAEWQS